jgi:hypothetical protein
MEKAEVRIKKAAEKSEERRTMDRRETKILGGNL